MILPITHRNNFSSLVWGGTEQWDLLHLLALRRRYLYWSPNLTLFQFCTDLRAFLHQYFSHKLAKHIPIVLSFPMMLSVIWAVNIWSKVPEYPLDFPLFPTLLKAVQDVERMSICSHMVQTKKKWRWHNSSRWVVLTFFIWSLYSLHTFCLVWNPPL